MSWFEGYARSLLKIFESGLMPLVGLKVHFLGSLLESFGSLNIWQCSLWYFILISLNKLRKATSSSFGSLHSFKTISTEFWYFFTQLQSSTQPLKILFTTNLLNYKFKNTINYFATNGTKQQIKLSFIQKRKKTNFLQLLNPSFAIDTEWRFIFFITLSAFKFFIGHNLVMFILCPNNFNIKQRKQQYNKHLFFCNQINKQNLLLHTQDLDFCQKSRRPFNSLTKRMF